MRTCNIARCTTVCTSGFRSSASKLGVEPVLKLGFLACRIQAELPQFLQTKRVQTKRAQTDGRRHRHKEGHGRVRTARSCPTDRAGCAPVTGIPTSANHASAGHIPIRTQSGFGRRLVSVARVILFLNWPVTMCSERNKTVGFLGGRSFALAVQQVS